MFHGRLQSGSRGRDKARDHKCSAVHAVSNRALPNRSRMRWNVKATYSCGTTAILHEGRTLFLMTWCNPLRRETSGTTGADNLDGVCCVDAVDSLGVFLAWKRIVEIFQVRHVAVAAPAGASRSDTLTAGLRHRLANGLRWQCQGE